FSQDHADQVIQNAQRQMEDHFAEITTVEEVAQQSGISSRHFNRRFKTATGESPLAYLQKLRIESAKNQLENTTENFEQITSLVGYDNSSTFRKLFKRYTSLTPASYRKKYSKMYPLHS
ncbi:helix-turn-helix domain-containing protein, partial [bacterium]|nr:helix-turn-helix domain-containing protein [bacterium]